jgi:dTDP-4-dehydrorhamnose reductase
MNLGKCFVIGASGVIGSSLYRKLRNAGRVTVGTRNTHLNNFNNLIPLDLRYDDLKNFTSNIGPYDTVYLMAAYSNPSWIFEHQNEAIALNWHGTQRLIDSLHKIKPHLVFMSSVEVFDGLKGRYVEGDTPNPINFYGHLKFKIEQYLRETYPRFTIVRTGWNVGDEANTRCVVRLTYESLLRPGARMADDNIFSLIDAEDTAEGLFRLSGVDEVHEIHFAADLPLRRTELANLIMNFSLRGSEMSFTKCKFSEITYTEKRGRINDLNNEMSKVFLNMNYKSTYDVVLKKVKILDLHEFTSNN